MSKMNSEYKAKWVAALRSGEYQQCTKRLQNQSGFCCIGVLSDIVKNDVDAEWVDFEYTWRDENSNEVLSEMLEMPIIVRVLVQFPSIDRVGWLVDMNDAQNKTFLEIADYIEENL